MKKIPKLLKKYVGWGGMFGRDEIKKIVIVSAKSRKQAVEKLNDLEFKVVDKSQIYRVCVVKYPGPKAVQILKAKNWNESTKIEDKDDG